MKKILIRIFVFCLLICILSGCGNTNPEDEMVKEEQPVSAKQENELMADSRYIKNDTFPTLTRLRECVKEEMGEKYWPTMPILEEELEEITGITTNMYVEFLAEKQVIDSSIDTMIIIHAKEKYIGAVEQALENYRSQIIKDNEKYPQNFGKAQASRMETIEDYICFVQLGADTTIVADKGEEEIISYCQEENERALHVLEKEILE